MCATIAPMVRRARIGEPRPARDYRKPFVLNAGYSTCARRARQESRRIDRDPEAKRLGRSAFIRNAVSVYLQAKERREVDAAIHRAYPAMADDWVDEVEELIGAQAWPQS
jgi:predicted RNA-binding protein YlxR (DUF448 family)